MLPILGIIIGLLIGVLLPYSMPAGYSIYVAVGILAALDAIFGGTVASMRGVFELRLFISGMIGNIIIAMALSFIGEQLGIPLYYAALFAFGNRMFNNFGVLRRLLIDKYSKKNRPSTKIN